ncbi:30S ribosomal protein S2 [Mycoplasma bradburyae]|uniref:Small ribosomal subunit protein uS2 n=1 Tax=Mycoplasma bradburyae TaxID=2963128 RepID=A0AAW6HMP1_9MOLU|nr:30S ribosomal protein S2 [Mycoplasma bradburyae]MDC4183127.1 30S ribosomal protein S2 [Mycoplasma bradburyae]UTS70638.1 30S ribosomal protein S2 [Mycoplasma bradburyae]
MFLFEDINVESAQAVKAEESPAQSTVQNKEEQVPANSTEKVLVTHTKLLDVGAFNGVAKRKWNPKMKPYIIPRNMSQFSAQFDLINSDILNQRLHDAFNYLTEAAKAKKNILFVGTKSKGVQELIQSIAERTNTYYINQRWLGGTLTNFKTIGNSINQLKKLIHTRDNDLTKYTKKEQIMIMKKLAKLEKFFGGIKDMQGLPHVIVIDDPVKEKNAVTEARKLKIPVIALCNTNSDPNIITLPIPANNYNIRSVTLLLNLLGDAVAIANGNAPKFAYKPDEEIDIPQLVKKETRTVVNRDRTGFNKKQVKTEEAKPTEEKIAE